MAKTNDDGKWQMVALLTFLDPPREDTKATIHRSMAFGVEVKMITGDHLLIAVETSKVLELGDRVPGRSEVVPLIRGPEGLPMLDPETKKAPPKMKEEFGDYIRQGHGFAQVFPEHKYVPAPISLPPYLCLSLSSYVHCESLPFPPSHSD